jgi:hypothetical protein
MRSHISKKHAKQLNSSKIKGFKKRQLIENSQNGKYFIKMKQHFFSLDYPNNILLLKKYY